MPVLSTRIVLDCFYLLIFYSEKFSTDVCRLPYAVNVNLNLSIADPPTAVAFYLGLYFLAFLKLSRTECIKCSLGLPKCGRLIEVSSQFFSAIALRFCKLAA